MTRSEILDAALRCVNGDRDEQYGSPEKSFGIIADFWTAYLTEVADMDYVLTGKDIAAMMSLFKVARIASGQAKDDNWIDLAGYAACGGEIEGNVESCMSLFSGQSVESENEI